MARNATNIAPYLLGMYIGNCLLTSFILTLSFDVKVVLQVLKELFVNFAIWSMLALTGV